MQVRDSGYKTKPIKIKNNVWIGSAVVVLMGSEIGENCVIGAGTLVKSQVDQNNYLYNKREKTILEMI